MKISILGTNGFLSTAIAKYANAVGWSLNMYGLSEPLGHSYDQFIRVDLMGSELDYATIIGSDMIVYAIGAGIQSNLKESAQFIYKLNTTIPVEVCNKLKELDYKGVFITFGSVFEIGETTDERLFSEEDILSAVTPAPNDYVISKRMLSTFVSSYKHHFTHWHFYIPTIYGIGENSMRLIPYVINAIRCDEELHFTSGDQTRQYIHVSEIPIMINLAFSKKLPSGVYNIQGAETLTVKEIVAQIHHSMGREVPDGCFGSIQRDDVVMKYLALDGSKLREQIGFQASKSIVDMIKEY